MTRNTLNHCLKFALHSIFTARNEVGARLCFYRCVWFCSQGGGEYLTRYPPGPGTPPGTRHTHPPWDQVHPGTRYTPPGTRYTPLDQVHPPRTRYTPQARYPPDQVHPPGTRYTPLTRYPPGTRYTPRDQVHPPGPGTPPGTRYTPLGPGTPPQDQVHPPHPDQGDTVYVQAVRILLECILVCHICYGKISEKNVNTFFKVKLFISKTSDSCFQGFDFFQMLLASHRY